MPEMVASHSSQRFAVLLDFQRDVDLVNPSHIGKDLGLGDHQAHHGVNSWQQSWSDSFGLFLASTCKASKFEVCAAPSPRPGGVEAAVTRSQDQFSPQQFIRNALKRALFSRDELVKRARFDDYGSDAQPMACE